MLTHDKLTEKVRSAGQELSTLKQRFQAMTAQAQQLAKQREQLATVLIAKEGAYNQLAEMLRDSLETEPLPELPQEDAAGNLLASKPACNGDGQ